MSDLIVKAHDADNGDLVLSYHQDVQDHLDVAAIERSLQPTSVERKAEFRKVMSVPFNVIMTICQETGLDFFDPDGAKEIMKILKRPEFKNFRTVNDKHI